ncbi:MAG: site-specific integrase [Lachnospiraceae bacterium]|nr:site-specific integrase [Lachnospiraceae bacterium]
MDYKYKQLVDLFLFEKEANFTKKTYEYYSSCLRYFTDYLVGYLHKSPDDIYITDINNGVLNHYTMYLRNKPYAINIPNSSAKEHLQHEDTRHITNTTIATYQRAVRAFFRWCWENEYTEKNIAQRYRLLKSDAPDKLPLYSNEVEKIDSLFNVACESGLRNICILHLMLDAGLRSGEVVRLKISDLLFDKNIIFINCSKGLKSRYVPLSPGIKSYLYKYRVLYRGSADDTDILFMSVADNVPITDNVIKQLFQRIKKRTGITRVHPHLCRHTFATSYVLGGGDLESLRIYMGHSDITTTSKYLHLANTYRFMDADVYKLDKVFFKRYY